MYPTNNLYAVSPNYISVDNCFSAQLENCLALGGTLTFDPSSVSDGNAIADCLVQLAPDYFTSAWRGKIISETAGNWKLRVSEQLVNILTKECGR